MGNATSSNTDLTDGATDDIPETYSETLIHITDDGQEAGETSDAPRIVTLVCAP